MKFNALILDALDRIRDGASHLLTDIPTDVLYFRADPEANTVAWLIWHIARGQDAQVADLAGSDEVWVSGEWSAKMGLDRGPGDMGYGDSADDVALLRTEPQLLSNYLVAVTSATGDYVTGLEAADLDRVIDADWDPPVTVGARLISIVADDLQHLGQAAFVRGLATRLIT